MLEGTLAQLDTPPFTFCVASSSRSSLGLSFLSLEPRKCESAYETFQETGEQACASSIQVKSCSDSPLENDYTFPRCGSSRNGEK